MLKKISKKIYKFTGDYSKLKELGYIYIPFLGTWSKMKENCSICIYDYVSVKLYKDYKGITFSSPEIVKDYIEELISNNLVEIKEY